MSHCCGGCGGEDPSKNKVESTKENNEAAAKQESVDKTKETEGNTAVGSWQPAGK